MTFEESYQNFLEHEWTKKYPVVGAVASVIKALTDLGTATSEDELASKIDLVNAPQAAVIHLAETDRKLSESVLRMRENLDTIYSSILKQASKINVSDDIAGQTGVFFLMALMQLATGASVIVAEDFKSKSAAVRALESDAQGFNYARDRLANTVDEIAGIIETTGQEIVALLQQVGWRVDLPNNELLLGTLGDE